MLKLYGEHLCVPFKIIFDNIIETSIIPDQWKEENVTPVHKKNDKQIITNYLTSTNLSQGFWKNCI